MGEIAERIHRQPIDRFGSDYVVDQRDVEKTALDPAHWAVFIAAVLPILVVIFAAWLAGAFPT